jgi:hypothetical protein
MSKLDCIYTGLDSYERVKTWTLMQSDHAGVVVTTKHHQKVRRWNKCVKLENDVVVNNDTYKIKRRSGGTTGDG